MAQKGSGNGGWSLRKALVRRVAQAVNAYEKELNRPAEGVKQPASCLSGGDRPVRAESEVAAWHRLSGQPDNVTGDGEVVDAHPGGSLGSDKELLRATIARLSSPEQPETVRSLARLAASYLLAGDVETARRYLNAADDLLEESRGECR